MAVTDECTDKCSRKYVKFMQVKEFFLKGKKAKMEELLTLETIIDAIEE